MHLIGGVGSDHSSDNHHVTGCMHGHTHIHEGNAKTGGGEGGSQITQMQLQKQQQDAEFSLSSWLQKILRGGKSILKGIWGTNETGTGGAAGEKDGVVGTIARVNQSAAADDRRTDTVPGGDHHSTEAARRMAEHSAAMQGNPYFSTMAERNTPLTPLQKIRARVVSAAEKVAGRLPGKAFRFQGQNSFHTKSRQRPREDLRKRSKYRKDELEIDCILTDESYLMDSYDRKGEYSQLTTKNQF